MRAVWVLQRSSLQLGERSVLIFKFEVDQNDERSIMWRKVRGVSIFRPKIAVKGVTFDIFSKVTPLTGK